MSRRRSSTKGSPLDPVFFVDADLCDYVFLDILGAAGIRLEVHDDHFAKGTDDLDWMVKAGENGWVVLSHNKRIRRTSSQTDQLMRYSLRAFMLVGNATPNPAGQKSAFTRSLAENFVRTLPTVHRFLRRHDGPWIARILRPTTVDPAADAPSPGSVKMWLTLPQWLKGR
jgi:hypothetical protein